MQYVKREHSLRADALEKLLKCLTDMRAKIKNVSVRAPVVCDHDSGRS